MTVTAVETQDLETRLAAVEARVLCLETETVHERLHREEQIEQAKAGLANLRANLHAKTSQRASANDERAAYVDWRARMFAADTTLAAEQAQLDSEIDALPNADHVSEQKKSALRDRLEAVTANWHALLSGAWSHESGLLEILDVRGLRPQPNRRHVIDGRPGIAKTNARIAELDETIAALDVHITNATNQIGELEARLTAR